MTPDGARILLAAAFSAVLALFILAPFLADPGEVDGLDGSPVVPDYFDLWGTLGPVPAAVYAAGDILCHQDAERSFEINGNQMPICVRDISALAGLVAGLVASAFVGRFTSRPCFRVPFLIVSFAMMLADVAVQAAFGLNVFPTRILTGALCGLAVAFCIDAALRSVWHGFQRT